MKKQDKKENLLPDVNPKPQPKQKINAIGEAPSPKSLIPDITPHLQTREEKDNAFFESLIAKQKDKSDIPLTLKEQNRERIELLKAGFTNKEIDEYLGK